MKLRNKFQKPKNNIHAYVNWYIKPPSFLNLHIDLYNPTLQSIRHFVPMTNEGNLVGELHKVESP